MTDPYLIDGGRVQHSFGRAASGYDASAVLQARVRTELLDRLEVVRLEPAVILDLGAGTGHASLALKRRHRAARVVALDLAPGMLREAGRRQTLLRRFRRVCADAAALPLRDGSVDLVFSNLMLQWCNDPDASSCVAPGPRRPTATPTSTGSSTCTTSATRWCARGWRNP